MTFRIFEVKERGIKVFRKKNGDYDLDFRFSHEFENFLLPKGTSLEDFIKNNEHNFEVDGKSIYIFCFINYNGLLGLISDLIKKGSNDIEKSDVFVYQNNNFIKIG